jgi:putative membrane protein
MRKISDESRKKIELAVEQAEATTSGEIVPVILKQSDLYPAGHFRLALVIGVIFSLIYYYGFEFEDSLGLIWVQLPGMLLGYLLAYLPFVKRLVTTSSELQEESYQRAVQVFHEHQVSMTRDRTGIMIFISLLERRVLVMADAGINQSVAPDYWDQIVKRMVDQIKQGDEVGAMVEAIGECGKSLSSSFPRKPDDTNEVKDQLITD